MKKLLIIPFLLLMGCSMQCGEETCKTIKEGKVELIGYRVAKHSHMYLKLVETGKEFDIGSLGGRRIPTIEIGQTFPVRYCVETGDVFFDKYQYVKRPNNTRTRTVGRKPNQ